MTPVLSPYNVPQSREFTLSAKELFKQKRYKIVTYIGTEAL